MKRELNVCSTDSGRMQERWKRINQLSGKKRKSKKGENNRRKMHIQKVVWARCFPIFPLTLYVSETLMFVGWL